MSEDRSWLEYRLLVLSIIERNEQDIAALREHCNAAIEMMNREQAVMHAELVREINDLKKGINVLEERVAALEAKKEESADQKIAKMDNRTKITIALISAGASLLVAVTTLLLTSWLAGGL